MGHQMRHFMHELKTGEYMSNEHAARVAKAEFEAEQQRKKRGLLADQFNRDCNLPPLPTIDFTAARYPAAADSGERTRVSDPVNKPEYTGGSVSYYSVRVTSPTSGGDAYTAECNDIIEALNLNYAEGNALKAIWRMAAARMGKSKQGYTDGLYDAEKVEFFGNRLVAQNKAAA